MKKFTALLTVLLICFLLFGCGKTDIDGDILQGNSTDPVEVSSAAPPFTSEPVTSEFVTSTQEMSTSLQAAETAGPYDVDSQVGYAYLAGEDFRRIKSKYSPATAICGYVVEFTDLNGDHCVLTRVEYKILYDYDETTLHNLTTGMRYVDPIAEYDKLKERAYGQKHLNYIDLQREILQIEQIALQGILEMMTYGQHYSAGIYVNAAALDPERYLCTGARYIGPTPSASPTQPATVPATQPYTEPTAQPSTAPAMQPSTEPATQPVTQPQVRYADLKNVNVGDVITFGAYWQDIVTDWNSAAKKPVEWLVLAKNGSRILVISRYALYADHYHDAENTTWEACRLRRWLNNTFLNEAFSTEEQKLIPTVPVTAERDPEIDAAPGNNTYDKIFLLSLTEANTYFSSNSARTCYATKYAIQCGAGTYNSNTGDYDAVSTWWLRSDGGQINEYSIGARCVDTDGSIGCAPYNVDVNSVAVRPAMWIDTAEP